LLASERPAAATEGATGAAMRPRHRDACDSQRVHPQPRLSPPVRPSTAVISRSFPFVCDRAIRGELRLRALFPRSIDQDDSDGRRYQGRGSEPLAVRRVRQAHRSRLSARAESRGSRCGHGSRRLAPTERAPSKETAPIGGAIRTGWAGGSRTPAYRGRNGLSSTRPAA